MKKYLVNFLIICSIFSTNTVVWASEKFEPVQEEINLLQMETKGSTSYSINLTSRPKEVCRYQFTGSVGHHKVTVTNHIDGTDDVYIRIVNPYGGVIIKDTLVERGETVEIGNVYDSEYVVQALCANKSKSTNTLTVKYTPYALVR